MAKRKKQKSSEKIDRSTLVKLNEISEKLGVHLDDLLERYSNDPKLVVEKWNNGELILLNEEQ